MTADPWADAVLAAYLVARDPGLGGAVVRGPAGPTRDAWLAAYRAAAAGPVVKVPLHADDARLLGGVDLAATLAAGRPVAAAGLLAEAAGGTIVVAMAERIDAALAGKLAAAMDAGLRAILLDEGEGDEAVSAILAERCGVWVTLPPIGPQADLFPLSPPGAQHRRAGRAGVGGVPPAASLSPEHPHPGPPRSRFAALAGGQGEGRACSDMAADRPTAAPAPTPPGLPAAAVDTLCAAALAFGVDSARAGLFAVRAARGLAALAGRTTVVDEDVAAAARLVLGPRATRLPADASPGEPDAIPPGDADGSPCEPPAGGDHVELPLGDDDLADAANRPPATPPEAAADRVVAAVRAGLPPGLVAALAAGRAPPGRGCGGGGLRRTGARGRPLPSRPGPLRGGARLALVDTLRTAAPWQTLRRAPGEARVVVRPSDFRLRRFAARAEATAVVAVDASGSAAAARLAEAKGAVELLLAEAYVTRAQVALVAFRGVRAEVVLPPTRSLARAKRVLADLAGGGGTPLAAGIAAAGAVARAERRRGRDASIVLLTDGRANIAADGTASRERAAADALAAARGLAADSIAAAFVDTSVRPRPEGAALAAAMGARYVALPAAGAAATAGVVRALAPAAAR